MTPIASPSPPPDSTGASESWRAALVLACVLSLAISVSLVLRHGLIEPAAVAHRCDAAPWAQADCVLRSLTVQAFVNQRVGIVATGIALVAWGLLAWGLPIGRLRVRWLALVAAALAGGGLVLYAAGWSAPALVAALLAWAAAGRRECWGDAARGP